MFYPLGTIGSEALIHSPSWPFPGKNPSKGIFDLSLAWMNTFPLRKCFMISCCFREQITSYVIAEVQCCRIKLGALKKIPIFFCLLVFCILSFFRAAPKAYGDSQARGLIGAVAAGLHQSCICDLHHSSWQHWILNPLREAKDGTCNLMVSSQIR